SDKVSEVSDKASSAKTPIGAAAAVAKGLKDSGRAETNSGKKLRHIIREQIDVAVPRRVAYNQWTQFAEFPRIVGGVESVEQQEDDLVAWQAKIGPSRRRW